MHLALRTRGGIDFASCLVLLVSLALAGCSGKKEEPKPAATDTAVSSPAGRTAAETAAEVAVTPAVPDASGEEPLPPLPYETALPEAVRAEIGETFKGDLDEMVKRRLVRVGVVYNRTLYFVDRGVQRGMAYEYGKLMEDELNKRRKTGNLRVAFWFVPMPRNQLLQALVDGKVDMVIAQLTVTPERQKRVDFTNPTRTNVNEVVVTGRGAPAIASFRQPWPDG